MIRLGLFTIGFLLPIAFGTVHPSGRCPDGWTRYQSKCFVLIKDKQHWPEAQMTCKVLRGNLASISNAGENRIIGNLLSSAGLLNLWIGLHDFVTEGHFVWIETNRAPNYTNWKHGQPDNHSGKEQCGSMTNNSNQQWNDSPCYYSRPFVCETKFASAGTLTSIMMK